MSDTDRLAALLHDDNLWRHDAGCALAWGKPFNADTCELCGLIAQGVRVPTEAGDGLRAAYLAGVRRGASDGMEGYPEVADDYLAATPAPTLDRDRLTRAVIIAKPMRSNERFVTYATRIADAYDADA